MPVLLDGDTGYGNFNNMRRLVRKLEQVGVAGVVIEDKLFPKTNSFLRSELQPLADIGEFCGKIKAGKDSQRDADFVLIARVEALIAGWGLPEALKRAEAYHAAGADAILIHSRQSSPAEIFALPRGMGQPLTRGARPDHLLAHLDRGLPRAAGQHGDLGEPSAEGFDRRACRRRRAAFARTTRSWPSSRRWRRSTRCSGCRATPSWPRPSGATCRRANRSPAVVLAAGEGTDFGGLTARVPKAMLRVQGRPILARLLDDFAAFGGRNAVVVRGHRAEAIDVPGARFVDNADFASTGEAFSLSLAEADLGPGTLVSFGDIVLKRHIIQALLEEAGDGITLAVDSALAGTADTDRVLTDRADSGRFSFDEIRLRAVGDAVMPAESHGCGSGSCIWAATALSGSWTPFARRVPTTASAARPSEIC